MTEFSISLYENPVVSENYIGNFTPRFSSWRHSIRDLGGCWQGEGEFLGTSAEMENFFLANLGKRIRVSSGGIDWYEGQIVEMELVKRGQPFTRTMLEMANQVQVIYSKVGPNLLSNPNMEGGASWLTFGTPTEAASSGSWYSSGSTSMYVSADAGSEGTIPGSGVTISASQAYDCSIVTNVASGIWTLQAVDEATSIIVAQRATTACGRTWMSAQIPDTNSYTSIDMHVISSVSGEEAYFDGAILRTSPTRSETQWHRDADSIRAYGRIEAVILRGEMADDEADGEALKELTDNAWPRTKPPERGGTLGVTQMPTQDSLRITCMGLSWSLSWRHALTDGTDQADNHITALIDESEFISSSSAIIDTNTTEVFLEGGNPQPLWRLIEKIVVTGDGAGNPWMAGVYPGKEFRFEARPGGTQYEVRGGEVTWLGGGRVPPLEFSPGYCYMVDMPEAPTPAGAADADNPKRVWLSETWFVYENGGTRLEWTRSRNR
jgi:hypothetical protein